MAHSVWINNAHLHVKKEGMELVVNINDETFGKLKVTNTGILWMPKGCQKSYRKTWEKFAEQMAK